MLNRLLGLIFTCTLVACVSGPPITGGPDADAGGDVAADHPMPPADVCIQPDVPPPTDCSPGTVRCGTECVALDTDPENCGACGTVCRFGCFGGQCWMAPDGGTADCAGTMCHVAGGAARCVDLRTDHRHCGACDHACPSGVECRAGMCEIHCS